jgi:hypothetical protein
MSTLYALDSVCGNTTTYADAWDINLNPHGSICCDNCESILICRKAWDFLYKGVK